MVIAPEIVPPKKAYSVSLSGWEKDFLIVGRAARASAKMLKVIAKIGSFVIIQSIRPKIDNAPQIKSKAVSFQADFLLKNEAMKTSRGVNPIIKVMAEERPTPALICAAKPINGAIDQRSQVTLLGLARPLRVSFR